MAVQEYFGVLDSVIFALVLLVSASAGFVHSYLLSNRGDLKTSKISRTNTSVVNTPESCNGNTTSNRRNSDRSHQSDRQGEQLENNDDTGVKSLTPMRHGLALMSSSSKFKDILFQLTCYLSPCLCVGFLTHVYDHGIAIVIPTIPAILAAQIVAVGVVNPIVYKYNLSNRQTKGVLSVTNYLQRRFGGNEPVATSALTFLASISAICLWLVFAVRPFSFPLVSIFLPNFPGISSIKSKLICIFF